MPDFEEVYRRYFADVYKYVLALSRDEATAEEEPGDDGIEAGFDDREDAKKRRRQSGGEKNQRRVETDQVEGPPERCRHRGCGVPGAVRGMECGDAAVPLSRPRGKNPDHQCAPAV